MAKTVECIDYECEACPGWVVQGFALCEHTCHDLDFYDDEDSGIDEDGGW